MAGRTTVAISSLVMRGAVGLRAISFALERRGERVIAVPTVVLPWHPGLGPSTRTPLAALPDQLDELARFAPDVDAVLTGYFANAAQVEAATRFIDAVRTVRSDVLVVVDPVTGDEGGRYVSDEVAEAIFGALVPRADVITPNVNELADMAGARTIEAARSLGVPRTIVTSALGNGDNGSWLVTADGAILAVHARIPQAARGTGDLFSAVLTSALVSGCSNEDALRTACAATLAVVERSGTDMLDLAGCQDAIALPDVSRVALRPADGSPPLPAGEVFGVDGCPGGWAVVAVAAQGPLEPRLSFQPDLCALVASGAVIAIDIPIGLPERVTGPGRAAEQAVRPLLGERQSSVFSIASREAVYAVTYDEACRKALATSTPPRKVSRQAFALFPKIRELDGLLSPANQANVHESHAELAFWRLNGETPMATAKRVKNRPAREGLAERIALLVRLGFPASFFEAPRPAGVPLVDLVDAAAIALVARRCAAGMARPFPDPPEIDARGLRCAMWA